MKLIETKTLAVAAASIEFTSIPQDGTDLVAFLSTRSNRTGANVDTIRARFNGVTTGYSYRALEGTGSAVSTFTGTSFSSGIAGTNSTTSNTFGSSLLYIPNYSGSTAKSGSADGVSENNATGANQFITGSYSTGTAAIASINFAPETGTQFEIGSTISLYKVTKGSDGIVTVS